MFVAGLVFWSGEHFLAEPANDVKLPLTIYNLLNVVRDKLPHFLHHIHVLIQWVLPIKLWLLLLLEVLDDEETVEFEVIHLRCWDLFPSEFASHFV